MSRLKQICGDQIHRLGVNIREKGYCSAPFFCSIPKHPSSGQEEGPRPLGPTQYSSYACSPLLLQFLDST